MARWIYERSSGIFLRGGFADFPFNPATEGTVDLPDNGQPDPATERYDGTAPSKRRLATQPELDAAGVAARDAAGTAELGLRATTATVELLLQRTVAGWAGLTPGQKTAARQQARADWIAIFRALN